MASHSSHAGRYSEAIDRLQKILEFEPDFNLAFRDLSENYHYKGMYEESLSALRKHISLWGNQDVVQALEQEWRESGYEGALLAAANRLADRSRETRMRSGLVAVLYMRAGEKDLALEWLERASEGPDMEMLTLKSRRQWDPIRSDPRFQRILQRMNFPE